MVFKLVISDGKSGLSVQKELDDKATKSLIGLKIGDSVNGELIDLQGFELQLTGGSDYCGFPMRNDVQEPDAKKFWPIRALVSERTGKAFSSARPSAATRSTLRLRR